jgi:hypothetical protein
MLLEVDYITGMEFLVWITKAPCTLDNQKTSLGNFGFLSINLRHIEFMQKGLL